jgi:hypothetical protein
MTRANRQRAEAVSGWEEAGSAKYFAF